MRVEPKFYHCKMCGNLSGMILDSGVVPVCCGAPMTLLKVNTEDASTEKHVPQIEVHGNTVTVTVGSVEHPMEDKHYIQWIYIETAKGGQRKSLAPSEKPVASFALTSDDTLIAAYEYCNLHGLWKATL